jgi:hypothetical protein
MLLAAAFIKELGLEHELAPHVPVKRLYAHLLIDRPGKHRILYVGAERRQPYSEALQAAEAGGGPAHKRWGDVPARLQVAWRNGYRPVLHSVTLPATCGLETATVYALRETVKRAGLAEKIEVTGGLYAMRGSQTTDKRPLVENTIECFERSEENRCIPCGRVGCSARACTRGYEGILGIAAAEEMLAGLAAPRPGPPSPPPVINVPAPIINVPAAVVQPVIQPPPQVPPVVHVAAPAGPEPPLRAAAWCDAGALPEVSAGQLRREVSVVKHQKLSVSRGETWVSVIDFAVAVGAVSEPAKAAKRRWQKRPDKPDDADSDDDESGAEDDEAVVAQRKHKAKRRKAQTWAKEVWPKHVALGIAANKAGPADVAGEQVAISGGHKSLHLRLEAFVKLYGK